MRAPARPDLITISIFDLDRTLTRRATYSAFLLFAASRLAPWRLIFVPLVLAAMLGYKAALFSRKQLKEMMQQLMLGRRTNALELTPIVEAFADQTVIHNVPKGALALLKAEQAQGRLVLIATAAHLFYLEAIAARLGVADFIGTASGWDGDNLTSKIIGENCYGIAKLTMLKQHFARHGMDRHACHIRFYSDHLSDLVCFEWADEPIAINPSASLHRVAQARGWQMLTFK